MSEMSSIGIGWPGIVDGGVKVQPLDGQTGEQFWRGVATYWEARARELDSELHSLRQKREGELIASLERVTAENQLYQEQVATLNGKLSMMSSRVESLERLAPGRRGVFRQ